MYVSVFHVLGRDVISHLERVWREWVGVVTCE